jgi:Periplasmic copper-binding protein (NosD)
MKKFRITLLGLGIMAFTLMVASSVHAQATRTWVSGVGDDVNPCSRTAPCKTFAGAISKTAARGEIDALDPGGYGAVTLTKSVTIDGAGTMASILASGTTGVIVNDSLSGTPNTAVVVLRNLSINGTGSTPGVNGVTFLSGKSLTVENCIIHNFTSAAANGNGINVNMTNATATDVHVRDTTITNCRVGIRMTQPTGFVSANINRVDIQKMTSDGIQLQTSAFAEIRDSTIQFTAIGVNVTGAGSASVVGSLIAHNTTGIAVGSSTSRISTSQVLLNVTGVTFGGGALRTACDNMFDGNSTQFTGGALTNACAQ